jgi:hypothetical protein
MSEKGLMPRIEKIWAFRSVDDDGDEGVCGFLANGKWMPVVAADEKRLEDLRMFAQELANVSGRTIRQVCFTVREDEEVLTRKR